MTYSTPIPTQEPDPLSDTLHTMRMQGTFYCRAEMRAPWGIEIPRLDGLMGFLIVTAGRAWFEMEGAAPQWLETGSLTLVPHGTPHRLSDTPGTPPVPLDALPVIPVTDRYETLHLDGPGAQTRATYGVVRFDSVVSKRFLSHLPEVINYHRWDKETDGWMESTLRFISREAAELRPGGETVLTRLADILVIQAIRAWLDTAVEASRGWLAAMRDPQIGRVLAAIHRQPERPWSLMSLAVEAGMSRSTFSARFTEMVGQSAKTYLTDWRMSVADSLLQETDLTLANIAIRIGYSSEPAFGRAFKRAYGVAPGNKRKAMHER